MIKFTTSKYIIQTSLTKRRNINEEERHQEGIRQMSITAKMMRMFKFGHIDMEKENNPVLWNRISKDDFNLLMKCKNLYEQCIAYTGRNIHEVYGCAGNLLNGTDHFLLSFTKKFINKKYDIDGLNATYAADGGWEGHTRKFLVEQVIPKTLKALAEK